MATSHFNNNNTLDDEINELSAFEIKENRKKKYKRRNDKVMKKQQRSNKNSDPFDEYNDYQY